MNAAGTLDIDVINWREGFAVLTDGQTVPITDWVDEDGELTPDRMEAVSFVCGPAKIQRGKRKGQCWIVGQIKDFQPVKLS